MVTNIKLPIIENTHSIINAEIDDLPFIYNLFEQAINYQKINQFIGWLNYDKDFIKMDIINGLLFKVIVEHEIMGIFSICFKDELIWRDKENGDAIYIHRVILNRLFTGKKIFKIILEWAISFSWQKNLN